MNKKTSFVFAAVCGIGVSALCFIGSKKYKKDAITFSEEFEKALAEDFSKLEKEGVI